MLSKNQLSHVCLLHGGEDQCRYLSQDELHYDKWYCLKCRPVEKAIIDDKVSEDLKKQKSNSPRAVKPLGDNCAGYPILKSIQQGYDC